MLAPLGKWLGRDRMAGLLPKQCGCAAVVFEAYFGHGFGGPGLVGQQGEEGRPVAVDLLAGDFLEGLDAALYVLAELLR